MNVLQSPLMPAPHSMISDTDGHARLLEDPAVRAAWEESALARTIGLAIGTYRERHGLTQLELGTRIGMSQSQVARLERMDHTPSFEMLLRLTNALGLELAITIQPASEVPRASETTTTLGIHDTTDRTVISVREA